MNDRRTFDGHDPHLRERMERAVGDLSAPDVALRAMARGRRQRTHRRLAYAAGGIATATALVLTVPTFAMDWPEQGPSGPPVAADPAVASPTFTSPTAVSGAGGPVTGPCGAPATGWWSKSPAQIEAELSARLPAGTRIGEANTNVAGTWAGTLITGDDVDGLSLTLLPPPGVRGPRRTLEEVSRLGPCGGGGNEPMQAVKACGELAGYVACEEIRSENGTIVGVVTEQTQLAVVDGREQPTDQTYLRAAVAGPEGGHVELVVGEGTAADRPHTVHDPADVPALTMDQVHEIVADPVWTN